MSDIATALYREINSLGRENESFRSQLLDAAHQNQVLMVAEEAQRKIAERAERELAALREQLIDVRSTAENLWAEGDISLSVRRQICDGIDLPAAPAEEETETQQECIPCPACGTVSVFGVCVSLSCHVINVPARAEETEEPC